MSSYESLLVLSYCSNPFYSIVRVEVVKKHRGPTMLFDVHACKWKDRVAILFNEKNQPIGPTDDDVSEFSKILGTMTHDHTWAPLAYTN